MEDQVLLLEGCMDGGADRLPMADGRGSTTMDHAMGVAQDCDKLRK